MSLEGLSAIFKALNFSAERHRMQRRKDHDETPYINHPISVAEMIVNTGGVSDTNTIIAALLHDTIEDVGVTAKELRQMFGDEVASLVQEVTDDKSLPKAERKRLQVEHASHKSSKAKLIKIADKISNVRDVTNSPPSSWNQERRIEYLDWTENVMKGLRGVNSALEAEYDRVLAAGRKKLSE